MTVDMHEGKFRARLMKMEQFEQPGPVTSEARSVDFSAWRAIFSSMLLRGHATGYRLPSVGGFMETCERWYKHPEHTGRFDYAFQEPLRSQVRNRLRAFYETGMAETYLYVCLVDVFEDLMQDGIVLYDPRADWKLKLDAVVLRAGHVFSVSSFWGEAEHRPAVEASRAAVERVRKQNTLQSSHFNNSELTSTTHLELAISEKFHQNVNGLRLMSIERFNESVVMPIFEACGTAPSDRRLMPVSVAERDELYWSLVKKPSPR